MSKLRIDFSKYGPTAKEIQILNRICKECGRYRKIPQHFCNDCWKEMDITINKENKK